MSHYETLGIDKSATAAEIKDAYRRLSRLHHPDRDGGDVERMAAINAAYECLSDPARRAHYDETGKDKAVDPEQEVAKVVRLLLSRYIDEMADDPVQAAREHLEEGQRELEARVNQVKKRERKLRRYIERVRKDSGPLLLDLVHGKLADIESTLAHADSTRSQLERALKRLDDYGLTPEEPEPRAPFAQPHHHAFIKALENWR